MGFRAKIIALAAIGSLIPWVAAISLYVGVTPDSLSAAVVLAIGAIAAGFVLRQLLVLMRPLADLAAELTAASPNHAPGSNNKDQLAVIVAEVASMRDTIASLQHRWTQQHPLTHLPTREFLFAEMSLDIERGCSDTLIGIIRFGDYDRVSTFDSASADQALALFAQRLTKAVGTNRPLAQVDRDGFAIWFRGSSPADARAELRALCYALGAEIVAGEFSIVPEVAASAATYPADGVEPAAIVTRTLLSLDQGARGSDGNVHLLQPKPIQAARDRFSIEQDLHHAISRDQLELHFQPVVDLALGKLVGAEALIRWHHPEAGLMSPASFIPILEDAHLVDEIGRWSLNRACRTARKLRLQGPDGLKMAVNLSAVQLKDPNLLQVIARLLEQHELPATALELELTETAAMKDADRTFHLFSQLRAMGISLAIDDFGSGYSSLSYVKNLPFDKLKIDREFVVNVHERPDSQAICRTLIELARGLRIRVLAEGVESAAEVNMLRGFGCNLFQGFYFSEPLCEADFLRKAADPEWQLSLAQPVPILNNRMTA